MAITAAVPNRKRNLRFKQDGPLLKRNINARLMVMVPTISGKEGAEERVKKELDLHSEVAFLSNQKRARQRLSRVVKSFKDDH